MLQVFMGLARLKHRPSDAWIESCLPTLRSLFDSMEVLQDGHCLYALAVWKYPLPEDDMQPFLRVSRVDISTI